MIKSVAFAPGHISGFFEPVYHSKDLFRSGSRGAGINISSGAVSEVFVESSTNQNFEIYINNRRSSAPVTNLALKHLLGDTKIKILVKTSFDLPTSQGFGISAAGALSATLATAKLLEIPREEAIKAAHFAEIQLRTGLGDVVASCFGGMEIRKTPGLPPWGVIEHIPCKHDIVICVIGKKIDTKKILSDKSKVDTIIEYGKYCTKKLLENPSFENFFSLSRFFSEKTGLADKKILEAIDAASRFGMASMCMLGNSVFAVGKTNELCKILSRYGKIFICEVDQEGARSIIKK